MANEYSIAVLLPSRARTDSLTTSVTSLVERATEPEKIQILFGFDDDDEIGLRHFSEIIQPYLDQHNINYEAQAFNSMGYAGLNRYYNHLGNLADADWLFVWNDDAVMETHSWDQVIKSYTDQFRVLKVHTHNEHPYSIFPIVPKSWVDLLGCLSRHQMIDAEISQNAYSLDIIQIVDIDVAHEQSELTGQQDSTSQRKYRFEGNLNDLRDFHFRDTVLKRRDDCHLLAQHMRSLGLDTTFFEKVCTDQQDPWEKLKQNDINGCMFQFTQRV